MIDKLRKEIDKVDLQIIDLISKRVEIVKKIGQFKKKNNIEIVNLKRFDKVLNKVSERAKENNISEDFIKNIYNIIHNYMCNVEKTLQSEDNLKNDNKKSNVKKITKTKSDICNFIRKDLVDIKAYPAPVYSKEWILLNSNENHFLDKENNDEINYYPHNYLKLIKKLSQLYNCKEKELTITNGSDSGIDIIIRTFCEKDEKVLICSPTFVLYKHHALANKVEVIDIPLKKTNFQLNVEEIIKKSKYEKIKIAFIPTPTAPIGNLLNKEDILKLVNNMQNTLFVIDEAYIEFTDEESLIPMINKYSNLIILRTLSKFFGMAGLRVGTIIANQNIINAINIVKPVYPVSRLSIDRALKVFNNEKEMKIINDNKNSVKNEMTIVYNEIKKLKCVKQIFKSSTNFYLVVFNNSKVVLDALLKEKIVVQNSGSQIENSCRITIGTKEQNNKLINVLKMLDRQNL